MRWRAVRFVVDGMVLARLPGREAAPHGSRPSPVVVGSGSDSFFPPSPHAQSFWGACLLWSSVPSVGMACLVSLSLQAPVDSFCGTVPEAVRPSHRVINKCRFRGKIDGGHVIKRAGGRESDSVQMALQPGRELRGRSREKGPRDCIRVFTPGTPGEGMMHSLIDSGDGQGEKKKKKNLRHVLGAEMPVSRPHLPELLFRFKRRPRGSLERAVY